MQPFTGQFTLPRLERVLGGPGSVAVLPDEIDRYGARRAVVATGATLGASALLSRVTRLLGSRCVGVAPCVRPHVPEGAVRTLHAAICDANADCVISFGGGSAIDTAKAVAHARLPETERLLHIALPTTLSAGEFTDVAGITDEETWVKRAVSDPRIAPRTAIADPELTLETPAWLWAGTAIRALDHAVETLYSRKHHPISDPLAGRAIELLRAHLPASLEDDGDRLAHRGHCQMAAWLAVFGVTNAGFGLSHVLGHQIGPRWDVPHGFTSTIMLPHAMRFMARVASERFGPIARAFEVPFDPGAPAAGALACADAVAAFIARFDVPTRLRDVSVPRTEMTEIAAHVCDVMVREHAVEAPVTSADLTAVLAAAY